jgi:hypothetical protein
MLYLCALGEDQFHTKESEGDTALLSWVGHKPPPGRLSSWELGVLGRAAVPQGCGAFRHERVPDDAGYQKIGKIDSLAGFKKMAISPSEKSWDAFSKINCLRSDAPFLSLVA